MKFLFVAILLVQLNHSMENSLLCSICQENFEDGDKTRTTLCDHQFHKECINDWVDNRKPNCPICRENVNSQRELIEAVKGEKLLECIELLIEGVDIDGVDKDGFNALSHAVYQQHYETVNILLGNGAKVDPLDKNGDTPLIYAAAQKNENILKILLQAGAAVDHVDKDKWTALMTAAWYHHSEVVKILLRHGANPNLKNRNGHTAYDIAGDDKLMQKVFKDFEKEKQKVRAELEAEEKQLKEEDKKIQVVEVDKKRLQRDIQAVEKMAKEMEIKKILRTFRETEELYDYSYREETKEKIQMTERNFNNVLNPNVQKSNQLNEHEENQKNGLENQNIESENQKRTVCFQRVKIEKSHHKIKCNVLPQPEFMENQNELNSLHNQSVQNYWSEQNYCSEHRAPKTITLKCFGCSSATKCFKNAKELVEFEAEYLSGWHCGVCGKAQHSGGNMMNILFPMNHCVNCGRNHCVNCVNCCIAEATQIQSKELNKLFLAAAIAGDVIEVHDLIEKGADIDSVDDRGFTALLHAAMNGNELLVKALLKYNPIVNCQTNVGKYTPLMYASGAGFVKANSNIVKLLLDKGANKYLENSNGKTATEYFKDSQAFEKQKDEMREKQNILQNEKERKKEEEERKIAQEKEREKLLIEKEERKIAQEKLLQETFLDAAKAGDVPAVQDLITKGAKVNSCDSFGFTALLHATMTGNEALVKALFEHKPNLNCRIGGYDNTPLHLASYFGYATIMKMLLDEGANPKLKNFAYKTALDLADDEDCKKLLEIEDLPYNAHTRNLNRMFLDAAKEGNVSRVHYLIAKGAQINSVDSDGFTALLHSTICLTAPCATYPEKKKMEKILKILLDYDLINVNCRANNGSTPLHFAARFGHATVMKILLDKCANPKLKNYHGLTAFDVAENANCKIILRELQLMK